MKKRNYLLDAGSKNYSNLLLDASHRVDPVCAVNEQANRVAFFFPAFFNAPGVKGGDEGFPVPCDALWMGIPVSAPPLCMGTLAVHGMRGLPGELWCQWLYSINLFLFLSRAAVLNFPVFAVIFEQALFYYERDTAEACGVEWRHAYISVLRTFSFLIPGLETGFKLVACLLFECGPVVRGFNTFLLCKLSTSHYPVKERIWEYSFQE